MRHPPSRPRLVLLLLALSALIPRAARACYCVAATCSDIEHEQGCVPNKMDIGFGTEQPGSNPQNGGRKHDDGWKHPSGDGSGVIVPNYPTGSDPSTNPDPKTAKPQPAPDPNSGDSPSPRPVPSGGASAGGNNPDPQSAADKSPEQLQAMAAEHVHPTLSQQNLEDKLKPLMQQNEGPGELPTANGAILASPISWAAAGGLGAAAAQPAPVSLDALLRQGNYAGAEHALTDHILKHPDDADAYRWRAMTRGMERDFTGALDDAGIALKLNPRDAAARVLRADALNKLHRYPEAVEEANLAIELSPGLAKAYSTRATSWKHLGKRDARLADLKKAAELDAQFIAAYNKALGSEDDGDAPEKPSVSAAPAAGRGDGTLALYGTAGGGLLLILVGVGLLFLKSGNPITLTRPPMRAADRAAPAPALEGFEIGRKLGEGGMGIVFEATDRTLRRKVALKEMREHIAADPKQRKRFLKEASTVASLRHAHIVEIHSAFESDGKLYLVFEYVSGEPLNARLDRGALAPGEALTVLKQIARALDYAHAKGVIHQDLKPGNIMVAPEGVKIMDFGIARKVETKTPALTTTSSGEILGTPFYMAPEHESGEPVKQSDLFALGVCAYEMLAGRRPFDTVPCLFQKMEGKFTPVSLLMPALPKSVDRVLAKAMAPKPADRHANAQEFVAELEAALSCPVA